MLTVALGLVAASIAGAFIYRLSRSVYLGLCCLLAVSLFNYAFGTSQSSVGGLNLSPVDMIYMALLIAGILRTIPRITTDNSVRTLGLGFLLIFIASFAQGVFLFGFPAASNEARGYVAPLISILYFLTAPADFSFVEKYIKIYLWYGAGLVVVAGLAYAGFDIGAERWAHHADVGNGIDGRYLPSAAAAAIANCFFISLAWVQHRAASMWIRFSPPVFLGLAIFLRHRTVWAMLLAGIVMVAFLDTRLFRRLLPTIGLGFALVAISLTIGSVQQATSADKLSESAQSEGTWEWRVESWRQLLSEEQTPLTTLFGKPLGSGYWRFDPGSGQYSNLPPHSEYVTEYLRAGVLGVAFLFWYVLRVARKLYSRSQDDLSVFPSSGTWVVIVICSLVYGITYSIEVDGFALVGLGAAIAVNVARPEYVEETQRGSTNSESFSLAGCSTIEDT